MVKAKLQARNFEMHILTSRTGKRNRSAQFDVCCKATDQNFDCGCDRCAILRLDSLLYCCVDICFKFDKSIIWLGQKSLSPHILHNSQTLLNFLLVALYWYVVYYKALIHWFLVSYQMLPLHTMWAGGYYHYSVNRYFSQKKLTSVMARWSSLIVRHCRWVLLDTVH